jgi:hypothetical protein
VETLVVCPCGHELAQHDDEGCHGSRNARCGCKLARAQALDAAVEAVKTRPWSGPDGENAAETT